MRARASDDRFALLLEPSFHARFRRRRPRAAHGWYGLDIGPACVESGRERQLRKRVVCGEHNREAMR